MKIFKIINEDCGSISVMAATMLLVLATASIGVVDFSNANKAKEAAQSALDTAVIACVTSEGDCSSDMFTINMGAYAGEFVGEPDVTFDWNGDILEGRATFELKSVMMGRVTQAVGSRNFDIDVVSAAQMQVANTEDVLDVSDIVLVLDVSDSMKGTPIAGLKASAKEFLNRVFDAGDPTVTIIPYAAGVPFPLGVGFERYLVDPAMANWNGCLQIEDYASARDGVMAQDNSLTHLELDSRLNGRGETVPFCPPAGSEAVFFSSDKDVLLNKIDTLGMGFGTATYSGLQWAWRALEDDANMPFRDGTPALAGKRAVILISDGMPKIAKGYDDKNAPGATHDERAQSRTLAACDVIKAKTDIELFTAFIDSDNKGNQDLAAKNLEDCAPDAGNFWRMQTEEISAIVDQIATRLMKTVNQLEPRLVM